MEKHLTAVILLLNLFNSYSQEKVKVNNIMPGHSIGLSYSTNGQLRDVIDEFYFFKGAYTPNDDVFSYKQSEFKINIRYEYLSKKRFSVYGNLGFSNRKDKFEISNWSSGYGSKNQHFISIQVGAKYVFQIDRFQFSTGLEIPYYRLGEFKEINRIETADNNSLGTIKIDGGNVIGINNITSIKVFIIKGFFVHTDMIFGVLNYQLGGKAYYSGEFFNSTLEPFSFTIDSKYNKTGISNPEFYFGVGYNFGGLKKKTHALPDMSEQSGARK